MLSSENISNRTSKPVLIHKMERILNVEIPWNCETMWPHDIDPLLALFSPLISDISPVKHFVQSNNSSPGHKKELVVLGLAAL